MGCELVDEFHQREVPQVVGAGYHGFQRLAFSVQPVNDPACDLVDGTGDYDRLSTFVLVVVHQPRMVRPHFLGQTLQVAVGVVTETFVA